MILITYILYLLKLSFFFKLVCLCCIFLFKATDDEGQGQSTNVPLKISLLDSNDNPPLFTSDVYRAVIDEGATKFEPPLQVQVN